MIENPRDALDDGEAEPDAARHLGALVEPLELVKDELLLRPGNAKPRVPYLEADAAAAPPRAD